MMHWLAHVFGWNFCTGLIDTSADKAFPPNPSLWRYGVRCVTCGEEKWFK